MSQFEILTHLEHCYHAMFPATENSEQAFAWFVDIPSPLFNSVMHLKSKNVIEKVDTLIQKVPLGNPISFWIHPENRADALVDILTERGFSPIIKCPLMDWQVQAVEKSSHDIRSAHEDMAIFNQITSAVFHFDKLMKEKYGAILERLNSENYLIFSEGIPIGTGILFPHKEIGCVLNVTVLPEHQRKGYGRAMMHFLMNRAHQIHLKKLVLLSSPSAEEFYLDLGFAKTFDIDIYAR